MKKEIKKKGIWQKKSIQDFEAYINSDKHKYVRNYLRNSYTHSVDPTTSSLFHDFNKSGLVKPDMNNIIPRHPFENLVNVIDDLNVLIGYISNVNEKIENNVFNKLILVEPVAILRCDREEKLPTSNIAKLTELKELIGIFSENDYCKDCEFIIQYEDRNTCKPKRIRYSRIHEDEVITMEINTDKPIY